MTVRDLDVEYTFDDPDEGWFGMAQPADATLARPVVEPPREERPADPPASEDDTDRWFVQDMDLAAPVELEDPPRDEVDDRPVAESVAATITVAPTRRNGFVATPAPSSWESRLSNSDAWNFKVKSGGTRYRWKVVVMAAAIVAGVMAIVGVVLVLRSPAPAVEDSPTVPPSQSAAPPAPTNSAPAPSAELPPPPPLPAPPPPSAEEIEPPVTRQYNPRYQTPDEPKKPQTNVTRTPMSATPPAPPRQTDQGRATPGESGHHGFFG